MVVAEVQGLAPLALVVVVVQATDLAGVLAPPALSVPACPLDLLRVRLDTET
ncbi:MAG: hypothetical protein NVS2B12_40520 [Ktedonobacteraceae bacterium]